MNKICKKIIVLLMLMSYIITCFPRVLFSEPVIAAQPGNEMWTQFSVVTHEGKVVTSEKRQMTVTPDGSSYFVYFMNDRIYLRNLNGSAWDFVGNNKGQQLDNIEAISSFNVAHDGTPYVGLIKNVNNQISYCSYKFDGNNWQICFNSKKWLREIYFSSDSRPYYLTNQGIQFINENRILITADILGSNSNLHDQILDFKLSSDDTPYLLTRSESNFNYLIKLYKHTGSSWEKIGDDYVVEYYPNAKLVIHDMRPYISFNRQGQYNEAISVIGLINNEWVLIHQKSGIHPLTNNFVKIDPEGNVYLLSGYNGGFAVLKGFGKSFYQGNWILADSGCVEKNEMFITNDNEIYLVIENQTSNLMKYKFVPQIPKVEDAKLSVAGGENTVDNLSLGRNLKISCNILTNEFASVTATIYNQAHQIVAVMSENNLESGLVEFIWDGKTTQGNNSGLDYGEYVPYSIEGINYTVELYAENSAGRTPAEKLPLRIHAHPPLLKTEPTYKYNFHQIPNHNNIIVANLVIESDMPGIIETLIYNSESQLVAVVPTFWRAGGPQSIKWDGKATKENLAGLSPGSYVPATEDGILYAYTIRIVTHAGTIVRENIPLTVTKTEPVITDVSPKPGSELVVNYAEDFFISASFQTLGHAIVELQIINTENELVASVPFDFSRSTVNYKFIWDGKTTVDNEAGLIPGMFVPSSEYGVEYIARLKILNDFGSFTTENIPIKVFGYDLELTDINLKNEGTHIIDGSFLEIVGSLNPDIRIEVKTNVKDSQNHLVAQTVYVKEKGENILAKWDGRATYGNNAGLSGDSIVPEGKYTMEISLYNKDGTKNTHEIEFDVTSSNNYLSLLSIRGKIVNKKAALSQNNTEYTFYVPYDESEVNVTAICEDKLSTIEFLEKVTLKYGRNNFNITVTSQNDEIRNYRLTIVRSNPPKPTVSKVTTAPSFSQGGSNVLEVKATIISYEGSHVKMNVYDKSNNLVAQLNSTIKSSDTVIFNWDGTYKGKYLRSTSSGTSYKIQVTASNAGGTGYSTNMANVTVYSSPAINLISFTPTTINLNNPKEMKVQIGFTVERKSNVDVEILNSSNKIIALFSEKNLEPDKIMKFEWDGTAGSNNTAGLNAGLIVPEGKYSVIIKAGVTEYKNEIQVVKERKGDINEDNRIDVTDILRLRAHILEQKNISGLSYRNADINDDGVINVTDILLIRSHILGINRIE